MENESIITSTETSNILNINTYIEKNIENKINQLFDVLPKYPDINTPKMIYDYTISELYTGTLQTSIDILNDFTKLMAEKKYISAKVYRERFISIFLQDGRKLFVGIMLVLLSFIMYFIDGSSI